ncbi:hypothetical protein Pla110_01230 [Polystyrenella longa]|uniref:NfeD-like C-terminal domain-containing protein n=1 Tax=Polystyrenella longa TaxID=2528007 RepID=A0A518CGR7_9PLAN|nr:NfeD family protein [Polystyrenella longa]QDU78422.1 hypothetical protein Pla110_01230 [Polystyrenella longa]
MVNYELVAILLMLIGLVVLIAEILIPSGGIIGIISLACLVGSFWAAWQAWWESSPVIFGIYAFSLLFFIPATVAGAFYILPKTPIGKKMFFDPPNEEDVRPFVSEAEKLQKLVGEVGKSLTMHNSGGMVTLGGKRYHSESEGVLLEPGLPIRVIGLKGNSLLVREISEQELQSAEQEQSEPSELPQPNHSSVAGTNGTSNTLTEPKPQPTSKAKPTPEGAGRASDEPNVDFDIP